jgi:hypothetical protein
MPEDSQFEKKDFDRIINNLLSTPPLRKNNVKASKQSKRGSVIPRQRRQPKREKATEA